MPSLSCWRITGFVSVFAVVPHSAVAQECHGGTLSLEASATRALPVTFGIEGVAADSGGTVALWAADGEVMILTSPDGLERRKLPDSIHPVGMVRTAEGYRMLDRRSGRELMLDAEGGLRDVGAVAITPGEVLDQAAWVGGGWVLALRNATDMEFQVRRGENTLYRSARARTLNTIPRYHLSTAGDTLFLANVSAPFELVRIAPVGMVDTLAGALSAGPSALVPVDSQAHWRALAAVAIDCGILLTLSDLTGDRRLLVRYALAGNLEKITPLEAPLGLMARLPGESSVLAARRAGTLELVWYHWRWIQDPAGTH